MRNLGLSKLPTSQGQVQDSSHGLPTSNSHAFKAPHSVLTLKVFSKGEHHSAPFIPGEERQYCISGFPQSFPNYTFCSNQESFHCQIPGTIISSNTSHHVTTKIPRLLKIVEDKQRSEEQGGLPNQ